MAGPFIKWAGGKGRLLDVLRPYFPPEDQISRYAEPFVGGGAVLFDVLERYDLEDVLIIDRNPRLIDTYTAVRDSPEDLIEILTEMQSVYRSSGDAGRKEFYAEARAEFNASRNRLRTAALFIFLNKCCYNGLYRENSKGEFNVPMGRYASPLICDSEGIREASAALGRVRMVCGDFSECSSFADEKTFIYFDPPYRPVSATSGFTAYTGGGFSDSDQERLAELVRSLSGKGSRIVLSNSDPGDGYFDRLYSFASLNRIQAGRSINSDAASRGKVTEIVVTA